MKYLFAGAMIAWMFLIANSYADGNKVDASQSAGVGSSCGAGDSETGLAQKDNAAPAGKKTAVKPSGQTLGSSSGSGSSSGN